MLIHKANSKMTNQINATELAKRSSKANWAFTTTSEFYLFALIDKNVFFTSLFILIRAVVAEQFSTLSRALNLNRPNILGVVVSYILNLSASNFFRTSRRLLIKKGWESHFLLSISKNDCTVRRIAKIWAIVHSDRISVISPIPHWNFRKYGFWCPACYYFLWLPTFLFGIICEQCAVTSTTLLLAELEMSILITLIPADVCESFVLCEIFFCQDDVNIPPLVLIL